MSDNDEELFTGGKSDSFVSYLTTITPVEKNELLNVFQYILLVIIPLVLFLKFMKEYIPPENPTKSTIEITTEVVIQLFLIFFVFWLIHKVVLYIPTYSNTPYEKINIVQMVIPVLFLLFCMKSSISEKMSILLERGLIMVGLRTEGMTEEEPKKQSQRPQQMGQMGLPMPMNTSYQQEPREAREMNTMNSNQNMNSGMNPGMNPNMNMNMNYGIQEPMAANEMGSSYVNY
jgi:hypothetical protein